jgi:L-fucose isomerase-like protein
LFRKRQGADRGVLVCLPNFGDEKGVADSIRLSELNVPILVQASPDDLDQFGLERRRDAFCGKISVCNNLRQYGIPYLADARSYGCIKSRALQARSAGVSRGVPRGKGLRRVRIGAVGARPKRVQHYALQREAAGAGGH